MLELVFRIIKIGQIVLELLENKLKRSPNLRGNSAAMFVFILIFSTIRLEKWEAKNETILRNETSSTVSKVSGHIWLMHMR